MTKINIIKQIQIDETIIEFVEIVNSDGSFTSMPKSVYDAQQAAAKPVE